MKSFSEIETVSKRASRAIGFSWGIAEEVGKSIRILELFGLPGIKHLNQYYKKRNKGTFKNLSEIKKKNKLKDSLLCPIMLGVNFLDQIKKIETLRTCYFNNIAYPLLLLPFLSRSSEIIGKKILVKFGKNEFMLNFNINITSNLGKRKFPSTAKNIEITFIENKDSFSNIEWKGLYKLSEDTFVEETDSLKEKAAGAGLTDND